MIILFMGQHYDINEQEYLTKICKNGVSTAHYKFQNNLIISLEKNNCVVSKLTTLPIGNFPLKCNKLIFTTRKRKDWTSIGFINLPIIKHITRLYLAKKYIYDWASNAKSDEDKVILIYDCYIPFIKAAIRRSRNYKIILVVPDLPGKYCIEYQQYNWITKIYKDNELKKIKNLVPHLDGGIVLTESMTKILPFKAHLVLEAICNESKESLYSNYSNDTIKILYAGELSTNVGIQQMIRAYELIADKTKIELIICGTGELEEYVKKKANEVNRIQYRGFVGYKEMTKLFDEIDICINPRMNDYEYTKYSFPSKNIEYLKTGKPVVAYKLDGIPSEYDEFLFYPKDNSTEELGETILRAIDSINLEGRVRKQLEFVNKKGTVAQGKRLKKFIEDLNKYVHMD